MMGSYPSSETKRDDATSKVAIEANVILRDVMFHLHSLEGIADSLSSATDAQYELIQSFFDGKGELKQPSDKLAVLSHEKLSDDEKKTLAYIQDNICTQATIIKKTVTHLGDLFHKYYGSSVESQSQAQSRHGSKKLKMDGNVNQTRMELNNLRGEYETQKKKVRETEKRISELCSQEPMPEVSGRHQSESTFQSLHGGLNKKIFEVEEKLKQKDEEIQTMRQEFNNDLLSKTKSLKEDNDDYKRKVNQLSKDLRDVKQDKYWVEQEKRSIERKLEQLERDKNREITRIENELSKLKGQIESKRVQKTVFLYTHRRGELLSKVIIELKQMLELQFDIQRMSLRIVDCENASVIDTNKPVLVLCINASRLGTDVSNALTGIQGNGNVSVIVLHHKETHALPNQSSERVLTSAEYKSLGGIIDMAFLSNRGIYTCDMNNTALNVIVEFIKRRN